jgi:hypothetical protein
MRKSDWVVRQGDTSASPVYWLLELRHAGKDVEQYVYDTTNRGILKRQPDTMKQTVDGLYRGTLSRRDDTLLTVGFSLRLKQE